MYFSITFNGESRSEVYFSWDLLEILTLGNQLRESEITTFIGHLIKMLRLLTNTTFSTAIHCASDSIKDIKTIFETSDTRLLDTLCDVNTEGKMMSDRNTHSGSGEKIPFDPEHPN